MSDLIERLRRNCHFDDCQASTQRSRMNKHIKSTYIFIAVYILLAILVGYMAFETGGGF